jgi:hypothetical protein
MKKFFETNDILQANFIVSILEEQKVPYTVTGLASTEFQGAIRIIEFFVNEDDLAIAQEVVEGI